MILVYALEKAPYTFSKSVFLAGPSPRQLGQPNWRTDALKMLADTGYDGVVFIPLLREGNYDYDFENQSAWENSCLNMSDVIMFWVPRNVKELPGFTTNVEWGMYKDSGKVVFGYPDGAEKVRYLQYQALEAGLPVYHTLAETIQATIAKLGEGSVRSNGEREVPLYIWRLQHFQLWYKNLVAAGNRLDGAKLLWSFRVGPNGSFTFAYTMLVNVFVTSENRHKTNEFMFSRPDTANIVAYRRGSNLLDTKVALIREYRAPARTEDAFVREPPGGSSFKPGADPQETMADELAQETGLTIQDPTRITFIGARQLCGTVATHMAHVFAIELNEMEFSFLAKQAEANQSHGVEEETERTFVEIHTLGNLLSNNSLVDWSVLGMIFSTLCPR